MAVAVVVELNLFLADFLGDGVLVGSRLLVQAHALNRDGFLRLEGALLMEDDLVLFFADGGAIQGGVDVGLRDGSRSIRTSLR